MQGSSRQWKVVYRLPNADWPGFLCTDWALRRLRDDLETGMAMPTDESPIDSTRWKVSEFAAMLTAKFGLIDCGEDDPDRIIVLWSIHGDKRAPLSHIQVKYKGAWESKMSTAGWVITHEEDDFGALGQKKTAFMKRKPVEPVKHGRKD
ncbi:hypothetical protein OBBRIDRAFT_136297 [Obba rivulosa]|uniref:Uncharacterized protein n=1 Tax=Obba rivulosa TaxID=1052685 RepID=A0A8E2DJC9_9APHY|nr:hypothetical protein OBBRIDRAFT_136297 [Obba rivulosa]